MHYRLRQKRKHAADALASIVAAGTLALVGGSAAMAQNWAETHKLLAGDGEAGDNFGRSIAINNDIVAVGAFGDDDNGSASGSAYLFDAATGDQLHKLLPGDGAASDIFGFSIAINDGIVAVGAYLDDDNGISSGSAYLFDASTSNQLHKMLPDDGAANDLFGLSIAINDGIVAVGAYLDDDNGNDSGSAYLFGSSLPSLVVTPDPLLGAQDGTFSASTLTPGVNSYLAYSVKGTGSTFIAPLNVTIDLQNPKQAGPTLISDGNGDVEWDLHLPPVTVPVSIWFQVVQFENKTNVVATTIQP